MDLNENRFFCSKHDVHETSAMDPHKDISVSKELQLLLKGHLRCVLHSNSCHGHRRDDRDHLLLVCHNSPDILGRSAMTKGEGDGRNGRRRDVPQIECLSETRSSKGAMVRETMERQR
jgi:hypothetical protein